MTTIYGICPRPEDITSFYRGVGPLSALQKSNSNLNIIIEKDLDIAKIFKSDIFFMQRPFQGAHYAAIDVAKDLKIPVWIDYDDDVLAVPTHNPHSKHYTDPNTQNTIKACIGVADVITVSSMALKLKFQQLNSNVKIIPNALMDSVFTLNTPDWKSKKNIITWRGGESHTMDLLSVNEALSSITKAHTKWHYLFMGGDPHFMEYMLKPNMGPTFQLVPSKPMLKYAKTLENLNPKLMITPLLNDEFNRSKSNIAWIEATAAGAAALAPDMPEWTKPGVLTYSNTQDDFKVKLLAAMNNEIDLAKLHSESSEFIKESLMLSKINKLRYAVIESLLDHTK